MNDVRTQDFKKMAEVYKTTSSLNRKSERIKKTHAILVSMKYLQPINTHAFEIFTTEHQNSTITEGLLLLIMQYLKELKARI